MGLIDEKNRESKISWHCPFKEVIPSLGTILYSTRLYTLLLSWRTFFLKCHPFLWKGTYFKTYSIFLNKYIKIKKYFKTGTYPIQTKNPASDSPILNYTYNFQSSPSKIQMLKVMSGYLYKNMSTFKYHSWKLLNHRRMSKYYVPQ
jgi:hypothetical protein